MGGFYVIKLNRLIILTIIKPRPGPSLLSCLFCATFAQPFENQENRPVKMFKESITATIDFFLSSIPEVYAFADFSVCSMWRHQHHTGHFHLLYQL